MAKDEKSVVVSIRIDKGLKIELERNGVNVSKAAREYFERVAREARSARALDEIAGFVKRKVKPSKPGFAERSIREDRDEAH